MSMPNSAARKSSERSLCHRLSSCAITGTSADIRYYLKTYCDTPLVIGVSNLKTSRGSLTKEACSGKARHLNSNLPQRRYQQN